ncbi:MAG: helix-turn-helix transcriptional regulator [Alphaproteobacteria bacterium]|nr:helix-turn-helix transcriptional regulator [Alphaproteobacteria bacterium]
MIVKKNKEALKTSGTRCEDIIRSDVMRIERILHPAEKLTTREIEILTLTAKGKTRDEISAILMLSKETIKDYLAKILRKLDAANKANAVSIACTLGIIEPYEKVDRADAL